MANITVAKLQAQTDERFERLEGMIAQLLQAQQGDTQDKTPKAPKERPFVKPCPDYATPAQRAEYDKLAARALEQKDAVMAALGTKTVSVFIAVPRDQGKMPHSIQWKATYSK